MRRILLLLLFVPTLLRAQVGEYRTDLAVGASAGYTLSRVGFIPEVPQTMLGGMTAGVTLRYTCEKYFKSICALQLELNMSQAGWKEDIRDIDGAPVVYSDNGEALAYQRKVTYLQIPMLARMGWGRERRGVQAYIVLGPQIGFKLSEQTTSNIDNSRATVTSRSSSITAQYGMPVERTFDYGITGGAGIELSLRRLGHFQVEARYYYGLGDIYKNSKSDYFGRSNIGQVVIKASYLFDLIRTNNDKIK